MIDFCEKKHFMLQMKLVTFIFIYNRYWLRAYIEIKIYQSLSPSLKVANDIVW